MTIRAVPIQQTLAIMALRQWINDRRALDHGKTVKLEREGAWNKRRAATYDSRHVRVIDFERVLATLPEETQTLLLCTYRNRYTWAETSAVTGISVRAICYKIPNALDALARALDMRDLL